MSDTYLKYNLPLNCYGVVRGLLFYLKFAGLALAASISVALLAFFTIKAWKLTAFLVLLFLFSAAINGIKQLRRGRAWRVQIKQDRIRHERWKELADSINSAIDEEIEGLQLTTEEINRLRLTTERIVLQLAQEEEEQRLAIERMLLVDRVMAIQAILEPVTMLVFVVKLVISLVVKMQKSRD